MTKDYGAQSRSALASDEAYEIPTEPIAMRDRIKEIDASMKSFAEEKDRLVRALRDMGFILTEHAPRIR